MMSLNFVLIEGVTFVRMKIPSEEEFSSVQAMNKSSFHPHLSKTVRCHIKLNQLFCYLNP
jgi:hypothetical protein